MFHENRQSAPRADTIVEILRCLRAGQVARTDGRKLLEKDVFEDWTFENLQRHHADRPISLFNDFRGTQYARSWSTVGELCARITKTRERLPEPGDPARGDLHGVVNTKRLREQAVIQQELSQHFSDAFSFLWVGISTNNLHCDDFNNVLVQISGSKRVLVFPPEVSERISRSHFVWLKNHADVFAPENVADNPELARVPWYLETLTPGEALVIPASAYHAVVGLEPETVAVNSFFAPRLRRNHLGPHARKHVPLPWWLISLGVRASICSYRLTGRPLIRSGHYEVM